MRHLLVVALILLMSGCGGSSGSGPEDDSAGRAGNDMPPPTPQPYSRDCTWVVNSDPDLINIAYPDTAAQYWWGVFAIPPGGEVRVMGEYPHARYMSFNLYDPAMSAFEAIADAEILPDAGSSNTSLTGADRNAGARSYSLRIVPASPPQDPAQREPNTLYAGYYGAPTAVYGSIIYRVYAPDRGTSLVGNVDLPRFRYVLPGGQEMSAAEGCAFLEKTRLGLGINDVVANAPVDFTPAVGKGTEPLAWTRFVSAPISITSIAQNIDAPLIGELPLWDPLRQALFDTGLRGGFLSNRHNFYVSSTVNHELGEIAVIAARAPVTPRTYENSPRMDDGQLRYWSLCTNDTLSQRYWDCHYDEQIPQDAQGNYIVVVSTAAQRPANARPECGVAWLNWGPLASSLLILRHMLPDPDFAGTIEKVPLMSGAEREVMGDYYPYGTHASVAEFEALSADPGGGPETCKVDVSSLRTRARS